MQTADVLLVIDVQNDFLPGGALGVPRGDEVVPVINALASRFANVILTQDWHTPGHVSFASAHPGRQPFEIIELPYGQQILWPDHCIMGTRGADFAAGLAIPHAQAVVRKGYHAHTDSYSAFLEADRKTPTGLAGLLRERGITRVYCCGLATDFCVAWSALDARAAGFETYVIEDACRAIDTGGSLAQARQQLADAGVQLIYSGAL
ncbi:MAG: bifunctional nicotinamidase/pyrazinamidase [Burkholderiaceae bacterium]|nr:bifunctional nicotinamidase/pyrazinamidase [Burkholderiaceae bacterium]MCX7902095.1 bifunctional nicotinamidase/pyrazinamidase [Burkholderiaceae bacterium]